MRKERSPVKGAPKSAPFEFWGEFTNSYRVLAMIRKKAKKSKKASGKDTKKAAKKKKIGKSKQK